MTYFPGREADWATITPDAACLDEAKPYTALKFAESRETSWPLDIFRDGAIPKLTNLEDPPFNQPLGPIQPKGGPNGLILSGGKIVAQWGTPPAPT